MKKCEEKFLSLIDEYRGRGDYDVVVAYSSGKDSTYTLDLLVNRYKLRALAVTFDNTFISSTAFDNAKVVLNTLGVDHLIVRPAQEPLRELFRTAAYQDIFPQAALLRASSICLSCIGLVKGTVLRTALEKNIPFIGWGWSPGQAPIQSAVMRTNPKMVRLSQDAGAGPIRKVCGNRMDPFLIEEEHYEMSERFPWHVHPLAFFEYNKESVVTRIRELGWVKPEDVDVNSTNCQLNAFANQVHRDRWSFHPYVLEIANLVRNGLMTREEGLLDVENHENEKFVAYAKSQLAL
jgi:hypothetical protein